MQDTLACFKAYDVRGKVPGDLSPELAYALGYALAQEDAKTVVIGHDVRLSADVLRNALVAGLSDNGISVTDIGLSGTEEIYYACATQPYDIGVMITGSHNPADENGFKLVRRGAIPISNDSGLLTIKEHVRAKLEDMAAMPQPTTPPSAEAVSYRDEYCSWLLRTTGLSGFSPARSLSVLACAGNGSAGPLLTRLQPLLPFDLTILYGEPDGTFPNGVPNPLLPDRREDTAQAVRDAHADLGVAFDGDFDRCFFYDAKGNFIEGYYIVGLLAQAILAKHPNETVIHDPRLYWNTQEIVLAGGGRPIMSKTGHAFIKEAMRSENAIYGGEMSAHHYFREFSYCDSGMLPFLFVAGLLLRSQASLEELVSDRIAKYPCSGEINRKVEHPKDLLRALENKYMPDAKDTLLLDGAGFEYADWRCNVRMSNTEPLVRVNVESRGNRDLMLEKTDEILRFIDTFAGAGR